MEMDYAALLRASKRLDISATSQRIRLALLSDAATQQLVPLLRVLLHRHGISAEIYEAPFDAIQLETVDSGSGLYRFQPDAVVILNSTQALRTAFGARSGSAEDFVHARAQGILEVWNAIQRHSSTTILQSTFVMPYERYFGNFDLKTPASLTSAARTLNNFITEQARSRPGVLIHDVEAVASWAGRSRWFDERFWELAKSFCALEHLPAVAKNIVDALLCMRGRAVKCVVLDLDNTLWGGVIGDDGVDGIVLNAHGSGEAYYRLQVFLKELLNRGILLAVASKNEMSNALMPFEKHPDMVLKRGDITVFMADWNDKAANIRKIRDALNIGFDSMVFLDDNPFERSLVRSVLPEVIVPELPEDPADYVRALCELNLFETASFSAEDLKRSSLYRAEAERREAQAAFANAADFLGSLDMRIVVSRFDAFHLPRIAQLIQRSNQFNLTTRRHTEAECEAMMRNPGLIPLYVKLSDRLGDHGLIGIVVLEPGGDALFIRDWLMSCRVLARGVEQYLMNFVVEQAKDLNFGSVSGEYI
ncbi:MAG: HAD family hydrolase, partial [Blastocatellia bacterium]|nr:HAD family hydrolase [Blastocatellia bacterium]